MSERRYLSKRTKEELGDVCYNCGSERDIEYHHIVPLFLGGVDVITNMVPLCHRCHKAAHCGRHVSKYVDHKNSGRKPLVSVDDARDVFDMFVDGEIGNRKCAELLGYSQRTPIKDSAAFRRYAKEKGILKIHNLVDVVATNRPSCLSDGECVGEITYKDGTRKEIKYKNTGMNDVTYVKRGSRSK